MAQKPKVIAIVGPTSSGKTSLSIDIAKKYSGEVISADSRQVYRGMDIGSGKVTAEEMSDVPHHLLDVANPTHVYTAAEFARDAEVALDDILRREHVPIIAGGTFFYTDLLRGKMQAAPVEPDQEFRDSLEKYSDTQLFALLTEKDPRRAETIDQHNRHRLVRALEIIHTLGSVPESTPVESQYDWLIIGVDIGKEQLHQNIHTRLLERFDEGMIEEVERLHAEGVSWERMNALGLEYRYIAQYLQGILTKEEMVPLLETRIKQFAKRQTTWLKRDEEIEWYPPEHREAIFRRVDTFLKD